MPKNHIEENRKTIKQLAVKTKINLESTPLIVRVLSEVRLVEYLRTAQLINDADSNGSSPDAHFQTAHDSHAEFGQEEKNNEVNIIIESSELRAQPAQTRFVVPSLTYSGTFALELEQSHLQLVHEAIRADDSTEAHTLLATLYPTQEEKILILTTRTYQAEINTLEIGFQLLENVLAMKQTAEESGEIITKDMLKAALESKRRQILAEKFTEPADLPMESDRIAWDKLMEAPPEEWNLRHIADQLFDDKEKCHRLSDSARRILLMIYAEYIQYYMFLIETVFSKNETMNTLPALWVEFDKKRQMLATAAELRRDAYNRYTFNLQSHEYAHMESYIKKMALHYKLSNQYSTGVIPDSIASKTALFSDSSSDEDEILFEEVPASSALSLPACYKRIINSKTLDELSKALTEFPEDFPGLATGFWTQLICNIAYIQKDLAKKNLPYALNNKDKNLLRMQLAAVLPNEFYFRYPVELRELNEIAPHPSKMEQDWQRNIKEKTGYFRVEDGEIIFTVKKGRDYKGAVHEVLRWGEVSDKLFEKINDLYHQRNDSVLTQEDQKSLFDALEKKALTNPEPLFVKSLEHIDTLLIGPFKVQGATPQAMYSLCKWLTTKESAIHLVQKWLLSLYMRTYPKVLDIRQTYKQKTLLQSFFQGQQEDYSLLVHLLLLGADPKEIPSSFYAEKQGLLLLRQSIEAFHQKKMEYLIGQRRQPIIERDFTVLQEQWAKLNQESFFYLTGLEDNVAQPSTSHRKFPQECTKLLRALGTLLAGKKNNSPENILFYDEMCDLYKKIKHALQQANTIAGHDDALLALRDEYKQITDKWPKMPKVYRDWFKDLRKVYNRAMRGVGSPLDVAPKNLYALTAKDPWFTRISEDLDGRVVQIQQNQNELLLLARWGEQALQNLSQHCGILDVQLMQTRRELAELKTDNLELKADNKQLKEKCKALERDSWQQHAKMEEKLRQQRAEIERAKEQERIEINEKLKQMMSQIEALQKESASQKQAKNTPSDSSHGEYQKEEVSDHEQGSPYRLFQSH